MDKTLADYLWTARWAIKNANPNMAYDEVTKALYHIGAEKPPTNDVEPGDDMTPPELIEVKQPRFVTVKGVKFPKRGNYKTPSGMFEGLTVHYTVSNRTAGSAQSVVKWLADQGYGCMVMDENGIIYIPEGFDPLRHWGYHSGVSKWNGKSSVSDRFAGMEICCWGLNSKVGPYREAKKGDGHIVSGKYQVYTEAQEKALTEFILWALTMNKEFKISNVAGHDELRKEAGKLGDKQDPGASLSMPMPKYREYLTTKAKLLGIIK